MEKEELKCDYLDWLYSIVCDDQYSKNQTYRLLFEHLYRIDFQYTMDMDANRAEDGVNLRYDFGEEFGYPESLICEYLDDRPCSVLEMIIALAIRCEVHIMSNPDLGDRVGQWFWEMIVNLGLGNMTDANFDEDYIDRRLYIFMNHEYDRDGKGGLFRIKTKRYDMRASDIWYQMCWYLDEVLNI